MHAFCVPTLQMVSCFIHPHVCASSKLPIGTCAQLIFLMLKTWSIFMKGCECVGN